MAGLKQQGVELLFLATPHEVSRSLVPEAIAQGLRVIDLSGAWRLKEEQHRAIYDFQDSDAVTAAQLTEKAVYGLPELNGDRVANAALVANPGCYATSVILAFGAAAEGWSGGSQPRDHLRFEVGRIGRGKRADRRKRISCRWLTIFLRIRFSTTGTWARLSSNSIWARRN